MRHGLLRRRDVWIVHDPLKPKGLDRLRQLGASLLRVGAEHPLGAVTSLLLALVAGHRSVGLRALGRAAITEARGLTAELIDEPTVPGDVELPGRQGQVRHWVPPTADTGLVQDRSRASSSPEASYSSPVTYPPRANSLIEGGSGFRTSALARANTLIESGSGFRTSALARANSVLATGRSSLEDAYARRPDLLLVAVGSVMCALVASLIPYVPIRLVAATPLTLVLPGYALVSAMFTGRELSRGTGLALVPALSIVTLVIGALVLDLVPGGLQTLQWALWIMIITLSACWVGVRRSPADHRLPPDIRGVGQALVGVRPRIGSVTVTLLAAGIAVAALVASRMPLSAPNSIGYTQLWVLPVSGHRDRVRVGVQNDQLHPTGYRLVVASKQERDTLEFRLRPGQSKLVDAEVRYSGDVTATLFLDGRAPRYRQVTLSQTGDGNRG